MPLLTVGRRPFGESMAGRDFKVEAQCGLCETRGRLWLGGRDYLECPDCLGTGKVLIVEERYTPKERTVFVPGLRAHVERRMFVPPYRSAASGLMAARKA